MSVQGVVASVDAVPLGSELSAAANVGDQTLTVVDVADFYHSGNRLQLNGVMYVVTDVDDDTQVLTLASTVTVAGDVGDAVVVWDNAAGAVAVVYEATVLAQGADNTGDPIMAEVDPGVVPYLPLGPRDPANAGDAEDVTLTDGGDLGRAPGVWWVTSVNGRSALPMNTDYTGPIVQAGAAAAADPLAALIRQNGQCVDALEDTTTPTVPALPSGVTLATGLVWHDVTSGGATEGDYFVYDGAAWQQVTQSTTLAMCAAMRVSQAVTVPGTKVYQIYPDPLSGLITAASNLYTGTAAASPAGTFNIGDLAEQTDTTTWWVYTQTGTVTNTWADWSQVTYPATLEQISAIVMAQVTGLISAAFVNVANDVATGNTQSIPSDLNKAANDIIAACAAQFQPLDSGLVDVAAALDGAAAATNQLMYVNDVDSVTTVPLGALALQLLTNVNTAADGQATFSVTDQAYTGTAAKISAANFLTKYTTARGTI